MTMTSKQIGQKTLVDIIQKTCDDGIKLTAARELLIYSEDDDVDLRVVLRRWYDVKLRDLTVFFLKCVVAVTPAALLGMIMYVAFIVFNSIAAQVLGGL